jgi:hypothetical protein
MAKTAIAKAPMVSMNQAFLWKHAPCLLGELQLNRICLFTVVYCPKMDSVRHWFREGFYIGLSVTLLIGFFLIWLWRPERQVNRHTENLLRKVEQRNWTGVTGFIDNDYSDQWGNNRVLLLERVGELFQYTRAVRITVVDPNVQIHDRLGVLHAKLTIDGANSEVMAFVKERVNSLRTQFELKWRRVSGKPWDWKLVGVSNPGLEIPAGFE